MTKEEKTRNAASLLATRGNTLRWQKLTSDEKKVKMAEIAKKSAWKRVAVTRIRKFWQARGMTVPGLAQKMGVATEWLISFDRYREPITNDLIKKFAEAFERTPRQMLELIEGVDKLD